MGRWRFGLAVLHCVLPAVCLAQTTGNIEGRVTDMAGEPLPGVSVEATSPSLQSARVSQTGRDGAYRFPAVAPGLYKVVANLPSFRPVEKTCTVALGGTATADLTLRLETEAQIEVSGVTSLIDQSSTTTGTNYTNRVIGRLPVDRNYADIVRSNPGVSTDRGDTQGRSLALTFYGSTSAENQWIIDGVNTTDVFNGVQGKAINNEFVQEVEVKTGGYQAEFGRALGGVVNVITKSGGNTFHGDGFAYFDSTGTAAEQQFRPGDSGIAEMRVADGTRVDWGFDLGGYLMKDRLWFFGAYNRVSLDGHISRVESSTHVSKDRRFPLNEAENLYSGKLTWNAAASTTVVATVFGDPSSTSGASGADPRQGLGSWYVTPIVSPEPSTWYSARAQGGADFGVRLTQLFGSQALATLQGSYHRDRNSLTAPDTIRYTDETCADGTPDIRCAEPPEPNSISGGYGEINGFGDHNVSSRRQAALAATLYRGDHEIKAGGDYQDGRTDAKFSYTGEQAVTLRNEFGQLYYAHLFYAVSPEDPTPVSGWTPRAQVLDYGAFVQDSWRPASGVTVNVGLRWDGETTRNYVGQTVLRLNDQWQPRIGVVWDPWRNGATKFYAFAGRFSYALPTFAAAITFTSLTRLVTYNFDPVSVVQDPDVLNHGEPAVRVSGVFGDPVDAGVRAPSQDELVVGVERLLLPSLTVGVKGTYRRMKGSLEDRCDFNSLSPLTDYSSCALINPGSNGPFASGAVPTCNGLWDNPDWYQCSDTGAATPAARRIYRGIELLARETLRDRLWLQASYVYSSLRGNYDGEVNQSVYGQTSPGVQSDFDYPALWHNGYGILALDRPHRFRLDGYWVTAWRLAVGLQAFVESGAPVNKLGFFNSQYGALVFLEPRGSVGRLPTLWEANLTLSYPIVTGPVTATLQGYLFNVFNNQIAISRDDAWSISPPKGFPDTIYDPNQDPTNPNYGKVTGRSAPRTFRAAVRISF